MGRPRIVNRTAGAPEPEDGALPSHELRDAPIAVGPSWHTGIAGLRPRCGSQGPRKGLFSPTAVPRRSWHAFGSRPPRERTMRKRASVEAVGTALLAALGLLGGCGGSVVVKGDGDGHGPGPNGSDAGPSGGPSSGQDAQGNPPAACTLHACLNPSPMVVGALDTGYDTCRGGWLRRRAIVDCPSLLPRPSGGACPVADGGTQSGCASDQDCTTLPNGYCTAGCYCLYGCLRDSDCGGSEKILCLRRPGRPVRSRLLLLGEGLPARLRLRDPVLSK